MELARLPVRCSNSDALHFGPQVNGLAARITESPPSSHTDVGVVTPYYLTLVMRSPCNSDRGRVHGISEKILADIEAMAAIRSGDSLVGVL